MLQLGYALVFSLLLQSLPLALGRGALFKRALSSELFPSSHSYSNGFTTADGVSVSGVSKVQLNDNALNVNGVSSGYTHNIVSVGGKTAWEAVYPKGSWNPSNVPKGGFGFYLNGPDSFHSAMVGGATDVLFSYSVMFPNGFNFNKGGKIPGAFGGDGNDAYGCSGGRQDARDKCFDARFMWRTNGAGELYTYLPLTAANNASELAVPGSVANSDYGYSVGRGSFTFPPGKWVTLAQRVALNSVAKGKNGKIGQNGRVQAWVDGKLTIDLENVELRSDAAATVMGMHFQTFFGGSTSDWASPQDQKAYFADVSGAIITS